MPTRPAVAPRSGPGILQWLYPNELFPTEVRGTAQTALYNAGRFIGGASAPVVIPIIAAGHGFGFAIGCVACIYVVAFIAMFFLPEKKGSDLE